MDKELMAELYQSLVLEHSKRPRNFGLLHNGCSQKGKNPSCGDELTLYVLFDNDLVTDIKFQGVGCALSVSSASMMTEIIKNKTKTEATQIVKNFLDYILEKNEYLDESYEPLHIYHNVNNFPSRVKCVLLAWRTLEHILTNSSNETINTEEL